MASYESENNPRIVKILKSLSLEAKLAQLDLALTTSLPRFVGVSPERYFEVLRQRGIPDRILEILQNLETYLVLDDEENFSLENAEQLLIKASYGSIWGLSQVGSPSLNHFAASKLQELSRLRSSSKLPLLIAEEGLHGLLARDSTVFPQAIAIGASFSPVLAAEVGYAIGQEAIIRGVNTIFAPVLDLALDARWGRCEETFGSDPLLVSKMGAAMVQGLREAGIAPVVKHFCAHGWVCGGRDSNDNALSIRELRRLHLPPFKEAVKAGALGIMSAYHAIDGIPCTASHFLLTEIIREEWQFPGLIMSDAGSIEDLYRKYGIVADLKSAFATAFKAGVELHNNGPGFQESMLALIREGEITAEEIDQAVGHVLFVKDQIGLLEEDRINQAFDWSSWLSLRKRNAALAKRAAQSCLTLLKNKDNILPLDLQKYRRVLVMGDLAKDGRVLLGDYCLEGTTIQSIYDQLEKYGHSNLNITFLSYLEDFSSNGNDNSQLPSFSLEGKDLFLCIVGESSGFGVDTLSGEGCDRAIIELPESQKLIIRKAASSGKPVVIVILAGRALAIEEEASLADAILYCYYPGEAGTAVIAETIFGDNSPEGNLPYDLPRKSGQVPLFYHQLPTARGRDYCDLAGTALFPFGFGLRYTDFTLSDMDINVLRKSPDPMVRVSVNITNTGSRGSSALVQLYCKDIVSSILTPEKRLVDFRKEWLHPGVEKKITFSLGFDAFALLDRQQIWTVEAGEFEILAGYSCQDLPLRERFCL